MAQQLPERRLHPERKGEGGISLSLSQEALSSDRGKDGASVHQGSNSGHTVHLEKVFPDLGFFYKRQVRTLIS